MQVKVIAKINRRLWPATNNRPVGHPLLPNDIIEVVEEVEGEYVTSQNNKWYKSTQGFYVWSGGVVKEPSPDLVEAVPPDTSDWVKFFGLDRYWEMLRDSKMKVTMLDSGLDIRHPDLEHVMADSVNIVWPAQAVSDTDGHGSHCAGILCGRGVKRIYGVANGIKLNIGKIYRRRGAGVSHIAIRKGLEWAFDKSEVVSLSVGVPEDDPEIRALVEKYYRNKKIIVAAIGNKTQQDITDGDYPAKYQECISVGSCNNQFTISTFTKHFGKLDICAPGEKIISTYITDVKLYEELTGTSMSAPFIAGLAVLYKTTHPQDGVDEFRTFLRKISKEKTFDDYTYRVLTPMKITL